MQTMFPLIDDLAMLNGMKLYRETFRAAMSSAGVFIKISAMWWLCICALYMIILACLLGWGGWGVGGGGGGLGGGVLKVCGLIYLFS